MGLKTFNVDESAYRQFSVHCKKHGISMSRKIENFIKEEVVKIKDKMPVKKPGADKKEVPAGRHSFSKYC